MKKTKNEKNGEIRVRHRVTPVSQGIGVADFPNINFYGNNNPQNARQNFIENGSRGSQSLLLPPSRS